VSDFDRKLITDAITRMLARREHSYNEICQKLSLKGIENEDFIPILEEFKQANIQCNRRFAESRARALYLKGAGPRKIKLDLQQHGVDEADTEAAFNEIQPDWFAAAHKVKVKKFGADKAADFKRAMKQKQFLQYRGFYHEHIEFAVNGE